MNRNVFLLMLSRRAISVMLALFGPTDLRRKKILAQAETLERIERIIGIVLGRDRMKNSALVELLDRR